MKLARTIIIGSFATLILGSCIKGPDADSSDYGPEENVQDIADALSKPTENMSPLDIKVGEFFAIEDTQELAGGAQSTLIRDTGATITEKDEDANRIVFKGVIHEATYENDGSVSKVSKEGNLLCVSKVAGACGEETSSSSASIKFSSPEKLLTQAMTQPLTPTVSTKAVKQTYHRLTKSVERIRPPLRVRSQPNCLNIPDCLLTIHRVGFDQVVWQDEKPTRIHIEAILSSDVPYLSRNLSTCYTTVATVDSTSGGMLVKQCSNIFDFRYSQ